jgi:hypothetical protein
MGDCQMQPIGIRPTNDFAFKKTFGSPENKVALISLLNAILTLPVPIVDVTIENPYNLQDFQNDKLSILDIRAVDQRGAIYDVEMQLSTHSGLDRWLYWLLHAHQYDAKELGSLFSQPEFQKATDSIDRIAKKTEDKAMYDTREKAIRDQQWILNAARREGREEGEIKGREEGEIKGREEGEIKLIQILQEILGGPVSDAAVFQGRSLEQLRAMTDELRKKIQRRT